MCGIAGIAHADGSPVEPRDLETLRMQLSHRGPDGSKVWWSDDRTCGLVHTRLAIIDTNVRADQPMTSADGHTTIVFNGEIFNFLEIRQELEASGATFRTESDTEVLLEAWRHWGSDMLRRLNGMWAFAIRDNRSGDLFLARDRFGIKPLLYTHSDSRFAFASEMRALIALPFVSRAADSVVVARLLFEPMEIEASPDTIHRDIRRLPAGHCAFLRDGRLDVRRWWRTTDHLVQPPATLAAAAEEFRALFLDSVRLRMRSDVRIGTCLSGGFDSTAVVSAMAYIAGHGDVTHPRESDDWRHAFVASFPGHPHDETAQARLAAAHAGVVAHIADFGSDDGYDDVEASMEALDEIYISIPAAPWRLYRHVRDSGIRVSLDGHGADELIGAYYSPQRKLMFKVRNLIRNPMGRSATGVRTLDAVKLLGLRASRECFLRRHALTAPEPRAVAALADELPDTWGPLNRRLYTLFHAGLLPTILRNFDRVSMAHGIEVRMPFMDWRLVVFAMSLPDAMKAGGGYTKLVAREALRGIMPEEIRTSTRKVGFNSQMPHWMNGKLGKWAAQVVARNGDAVFDETVDRRALVQRIESLTAKKAWTWENTSRLWPYINLKWRLDRLSSTLGTSLAG